MKTKQIISGVAVRPSMLKLR